MTPIIELIEKLFRGKLSPEETKLLNQKRQDPNFESDLKGYEKAFKAIQLQGELDLKNRLQQKERALYGKPRSIPLFWRALSVAAVLALCLTTFLFWPKGPETQNYLAEYFQPALNTVNPATRGNTTNNSSDAQTLALQAYNLQNYPEAIVLFKKMESQEVNESTQFYLANALLATGQSEAAIPLLNELNQQNGRYAYQSKWYLALAYLDRDQVQKARPLLQQIANQNGAKQELATQLLDAL